MDCFACRVSKPVFYFWKGSKVIIAACNEHLLEITTALSRAQDGGEKDSISHNLGKMKSANIQLIILADKTPDDGRASLMLGHALLSGKPLILVIKRDMAFPSKLIQVADAIEYFDTIEDMSRAADRALKRIGI